MQLHKFWTEKQTKDGQENILILFRECFISLIKDVFQPVPAGKLREGIFASKRSDAFAIEGTLL